MAGDPSTSGRVEKSEERWENNDPTSLANSNQESGCPHGPAEMGERSHPLTAQRNLLEIEFGGIKFLPRV